MEKIRGLITPEEAKKLNDDYTVRCELVSKEVVGKPDNRSSWFSVKDIKKFLKYARKQAKENGYKMNGIRIYCGAHGEDGYSTSFIVPTADIPQGKGGNGNGKSDIPDANGLNGGDPGFPPSASYPQE